jgi:hypothetical protein
MNKQVALTCVHKRKNKTLKGKMMIKEQNNLKAIKIMNKRENLGQLAFEC